MDKKSKLDSPDDNGDQVRDVKLRDCGPVTLSDKGPTIKPFEVALFSPSQIIFHWKQELYFFMDMNNQYLILKLYAYFLLNKRLFIYLLHLSGQNIYLFLRNVK